MELDFSTFLLEILNFLVLVWILKRFLYKPVLAAIGRRKAAVDRILADAEAKDAEARELEQQYQHRLTDWEREKEQLRIALSDEIATQRERMMAELRTALDREREKESVLEKRRFEESRRHAEVEGSGKAVQFAARLFGRITGPDLEKKLIALAVEDLAQLPAPRLAALRAACGDSQREIQIASAFPMAPEQRSVIAEELKKVVRDDVKATFQVDSSLLAGLRISIGPWTVRANLKDELAFFAERVSDDSGKQ